MKKKTAKKKVARKATKKVAKKVAKVEEPIADIGLEPMDKPLLDIDGDPITPIELFKQGNGAWYGELNPPVVLWRMEHWSKEAFSDKYGHKTELLEFIFDKHDLIYDRNNSTSG